MIYSRSSIRTDDQGKELQENGLQLFHVTVNDGDIHQYAASCIPFHWHQELEAFLLLEGEVEIGVGDSSCRLNAGEGCFINTGIIHSFSGLVPSPCRYRSFVFGSDIVAGTPGSVFDTMYVRPLLEEGVPFLEFRDKTGDGLYFEQFHRAFKACQEERDGYEFQVREALSNIVLHAKEKSRIMPSRKIPAVQEERLKAMLRWIDGHVGQSLSVGEIAKQANICPRECQRMFGRYLHYTPVEYVQRRRIFAAARQLACTDRPVTEIALSCGFSSPSYFSKQFKAVVGSTPAKYRSAVRERQGMQQLSLKTWGKEV